MKTFKILFTHELEVTLDETKFTEEFLQEFRDSHDNFDDVEEHAAHLGQLYARGIAGGWGDDFVEGYGSIKDFDITFKDVYQDVEVID